MRVETRVRAHSVPVAACMVACALWELSPFPLRVGGRFRGFRRARLVRLKPVHSVSQGKPTWRPPARTTGCRCSRAIWTPMPLAHSTRRASHRPPLGVSPDTPKFVIPMCTVKTHTEGVGRTVLYRTPPGKRQGREPYPRARPDTGNLCVCCISMSQRASAALPGVTMRDVFTIV